MGQEILYCHQCATRLVSDDFTRGRAHTIDRRSYCSTCIKNPIVAPPEAELKTRLSKSSKPPLPLGIKLGLAGVGVLAVAALYLVTRPAAPAGPATATTAPPKPAPPRPGEEAEALLRKIDTDLRALNVRVDVPVNLEQFGAAIGLLQDARKTHDAKEWVGPIDARIRALRADVETRYEELKHQAIQARTRGVLAEVDRIKERVAQWAIPEFVTGLDNALSAVRIAAPIPAGGLRLIPASPAGARVQRRHGVTKDGAVEAIPFGPIRTVGFEGDLFQVPTDGEVQVTFVTDAVQPIQLRLRVVGDKGQSVAYDWMVRSPKAGTPVQVEVNFRQFTDGGRSLPVGSIVKQLHVAGHDPKVAFRVSELTVEKRRD